ncbi:hypothetical protein B9479_003592 [Cryptococcus floricola]|uniref:Uncharacterized protein n=1 Tax=Cryptococcus floricola TaxID=2591691 RepID=A0A5D3AY28_9TREE|nr:hypothetical protein B9479_003592 [Cryptococcus floricola]
MFSTSNILYALLSTALLPYVAASPAPDMIFLLKESSFTPLGCSSTFRPTSILHQVPSPQACFSRCSSSQLAAYTSPSSSSMSQSVLCACGSEEMMEGIGRMDRCKGNNWYLYSNEEVDELVIVEDDERMDKLSVFSRKGEKSRSKGPMPLAMLKKLTATSKNRIFNW